MQRIALTPFDFRNLTLEGRGVNGIDPRSFTSSYSTFGSVGVVADAQLVDRFTVASLVFLLWDVIITLEDEVRLVWSQKWNSMKVLYIVVRYFSTLAQIPLLLKGTILPVPFRYTRSDCFKWQLYQIFSALIIVAALDAILIGRGAL
ncbi:hypothetical protein D9613_006278 [Agrocybe pediades]|uniref:DUF6533 domain-containing protein n=1 Tax=Agrocybe pediades TaxID=84607 RepID=A0A8H4QVA2_9AGAR|nr:hypothetical protein D9613_006278 [Agrocybe pediades]